MQFSVATLQVSSTIDVKIEIYRLPQQVWLTNQCFELYIPSPYKNPADYVSFKKQTPPTCQGITDGITMNCNIKSGRTDTLQFVFTSLTTIAQTQNSLRFTFSNFNTPFSAQVLSNIQITSYADAACSGGLKSTVTATLTPIAQFLPSSAIQVSSSSNQIGYIGDQNTLTVAFKPQTTMAPGGSGKIEIGLPNWYSVGNTNVLAYDPEALNKCKSDCMTITQSILQGQLINIKYTQMKITCIKDAVITIACSSFYNPIWPDIWYGFYVKTYDNETPFRPIEQSDETPSLDARNYIPGIIPKQNFGVSPSNSTVNTVSEWLLDLNSNIPMMRECYIQIKLPADFTFLMESIQASGIFLPKSTQSVLFTNDITILPGTPQDLRTTLTFAGCNQDSSLGERAQGSLFIRSIRTQKGIKDSDQFGIKIFKDEELTQLIAKLDDGFIIAGSTLKAGELNNLSLFPLVTQVQLNTLLYISFQTTHDLYIGAKIIVNLPSGLQLPTVGTQLKVVALETISSGNQPSTQATLATVLQNNTLEILDFVLNKDRIAPYQFSFAVVGVKNQNSAKDAGGYTITTYYRAISDNKYYLVDTGNQTSSFVATAGLIDASGEIQIDNPTNNIDDAIYTLKFIPPSIVPQGGYIKVDIPNDIFFNAQKMKTIGSCATQQCTSLGQSLTLKTISASTLNEFIVIQIGGIKNPRTFHPTGSFIITTYDADGVSLIDYGFKKNTANTIAGTITKFKLERQSLVNGAINDYSFSLNTDTPIVPGDVLKFTFPEQFQVQGSSTKCQSSDQIKCSISGNDIQIIINQLQTDYQMSWTMTNIRNPKSFRPTESFANIYFVSSNGYLVSQLKSATPVASVTNTIPAQIKTYNLYQESFLSLDNKTYTIVFTPVTSLSSTGSIKLTYPPQISMLEGVATKCIITTNQVLAANCLTDVSSRTIIIKNAFAQTQSYSNQITIAIQNVTNPIDNRPGSGFDLQTYEDAQMQYIQDTVSNIMTPILQCDYPCATCSIDNRLNCTSCWQNSIQNPKYLTLFPNQLGKCQNSCDYGFTTNGSPDLNCKRCDSSCDGCNDNGQIGDAQKCIKCSKLSPYRLIDSQYCLSTCNTGIFQINETVCGLCDKPCVGCLGTKDFCTSCDKNSTLPKLYNNKCIAACPVGTADVAGVCQQCQSPCKTCIGNAQFCDLCDETTGKIFLVGGNCYNVCPAGYATNFQNKSCVGCLPGCNQCQLQNTSVCTQCAEKLLLYNDGCRGSCPSGLKSKGQACVPTNIDDATLLYFPFLICALLLIITIYFGKLKKKAILVDGKMKLISEQNSISAVAAFIAPLQTLTTILQFVLSIYYGYYTHFYLALIIYIIQIGFNIAYFAWYIKNFYSKYIPEVGTTVVVNKKVIEITKENQENFEQDRDPDFKQYVEKHTFTSYIIFAMTGGCHFKTSKLFYAHFYSFDMFKAHWTRATYLRESMVKWQIGYLCAVDLTLIGISVYGLLSINWNTQLFITMIESILLSLLIILVGVIEKCYIVQILAYTEQKQEVKNVNAMNGFFKKLNLQKKIQKISRSKSSFKERKLEDLLSIFGKRSCKSMIDLTTGVEKEEDPKESHSWPISPEDYDLLMNHILKVGHKFQSTDAYELYNNVYTDGVTKIKKKDIMLQAGEPGRREFQDALNRKGNNFSLSQLDQTTDELIKLRSQRRRGRKNKYYDRIDIEDQHDVDEASEQETYLRLIKQQEDEEETLREILNQQSNKAREIFAAKKIKEAQQLAKEREEIAEQELRKKQAMQVEALKQEQIVKNLKLQQEELARKRLLQELAEQNRLRKLQEEEEMRRDIEASFQARKLYEEMEAARVKAEAEEKRRKQAELDAIRAAEIEAEKLAKQQILERIERERQEADARKLIEKKLLEAQQELLREQEKEAQRLLDERIRLERHAREAAEKLAKQMAEEQAAMELQLQKELEKARLLQVKQAEREERVAEKLRREEDEKNAKELRRLAEEAESKARKQEKLASKAARALEEAKQKEEIRVAAQTYAKKLVDQDQTRQRLTAETELQRQIEEQKNQVKSQIELARQLLLADSNFTVDQELQTQKDLEKARALQIKNAERAQREAENQRREEEAKAKRLAESKANQDQKQDFVKEQADKKARQLANQMATEPVNVQLKPQSDNKLSPKTVILPRPSLPVQFSIKDLAPVGKLKKEPQKLSQAALSTLNREEIKPKQQLIETNPRRMNRSNTIVHQDELNSTLVDMNENVIKNFGFSKQQESLITIPPNAGLRTFNEHDVLGDLDRDDKANVVILQDRSGRKHDKKRNLVNKRGFLVNTQTGDVIDTISGQLMFNQTDLDEREELPAPFCLEKHNFNPHDCMGDFDYVNGKPNVIQKAPGVFYDKSGRKVNEKGWYVQSTQLGHIIDKDGRKKFDRKQLVSSRFVDLPKLYNYSGKRFDIRDVMGEFEKDQHGNIQLHQTNNGRQLMDSLGRFCNEKGYLTDGSGNIIDRSGKLLFNKNDLKSGEFIKIFPFSKFSIARIQGDIGTTPNGNPILEKQPNGSYIDKKGKLINVRGYLVDRFGNVIDKFGKPMFDKVILEPDGEIPYVFRTGLLRQDTASSISRLMSEVDKNTINQTDFGMTIENINDSAYDRMKRENDGDTSVDSKMEDTPANYNIVNQRFERNSDVIDDYIPTNIHPIIPPIAAQTTEYFMQSDFSSSENPAVVMPKNRQKTKNKKKKPRMTTIEFLEPTNRDKNMAGAYGGEPKAEPRRPRIKYDKDRLKKSKKFRLTTADEPFVRAQLTKLDKTGSSGFIPTIKKTSINDNYKDYNKLQPTAQTVLPKDSTGYFKNQKPKKSTIHIEEPDFEQVYGKDIDQFLDDSEWDIDQMNFGDETPSSDEYQPEIPQQKLKEMEKKYLQRADSPKFDMKHGTEWNNQRPQFEKESPPRQQNKRSPEKSNDSPPSNKKKKSPVRLEDSPLRTSKSRSPSKLNESTFNNSSRKKLKGDSPVRGPDRETIQLWTNDPGIIHRGNMLEFETRL